MIGRCEIHSGNGYFIKHTFIMAQWNTTILFASFILLFFQAYSCYFFNNNYSRCVTHDESQNILTLFLSRLISTHQISTFFPSEALILHSSFAIAQPLKNRDTGNVTQCIFRVLFGRWESKCFSGFMPVEKKW